MRGSSTACTVSDSRRHLYREPGTTPEPHTQPAHQRRHHPRKEVYADHQGVPIPTAASVRRPSRPQRVATPYLHVVVTLATITPGRVMAMIDPGARATQDQQTNKPPQTRASTGYAASSLNCHTDADPVPPVRRRLQHSPASPSVTVLGRGQDHNPPHPRPHFATLQSRLASPSPPNET